MAGRFADKRVIVTGASSGIGAAAARQFAAEGACVVLVARRKEALEAIARDIGIDRALVVAADVTDAAAMEAMLKRTQEHFGRVDILVNNAGYHARGRLEQRSPNELAQMIDVNLKAPVMLCRMTLPYLRRGGARGPFPDWPAACVQPATFCLAADACCGHGSRNEAGPERSSTSGTRCCVGFRRHLPPRIRIAGRL